MRQEETFDLTLARACARAVSGACGVGCMVSDAAGQVRYECGYGCASCQICRLAGRGEEECIRAHIYGMTEAERFGGKYVYFCPMGLTCFVSPILGSEHVEAKVTVGPFLMVERQDYITCDLVEQMHLAGEPLETVSRELERLPYIPAERVDHMSTLLFMAVGFLNNVSAADRMLETQGSDAIQGQITAYIQELKTDGDRQPYPFETEQAFLRAVRHADQGEAQRLLNELLGYILFSTGGDLIRAKTRINELLVLLSRTAVDAGAEAEQTLQANHRYLLDLGGIRNFDTLCLWLTRVTNTLMDSIFDTSGARHANVIHQSVQYLATHYRERVTLEEMARRVYLSPSYFSRVFRQETGETFSGYLNRLRIERSKELLRHKELRLTDIAQKVGFEDQSYFTKVFKKLEGVTPLRYRSGN